MPRLWPNPSEVEDVVEVGANPTVRYDSCTSQVLLWSDHNIYFGTAIDNGHASLHASFACAWPDISQR